MGVKTEKTVSQGQYTINRATKSLHEHILISAGDTTSEGTEVRRHAFLRLLGPGLLSGTSGNDPSAVTTYAIDGARIGYGHLWLLLFTTPLYYAVQFACAKIGRVSQKGLSQLLLERYGTKVALSISLLLSISNVALIAADLAAIGSGLELIMGIAWGYFIAPLALALWFLTCRPDFEAFKKIFLTMSLVFLAYILASIFTQANWGSVLMHTLIPQMRWDLAGISSAVALLGATISPYSMFWQSHAEIEEQRGGTLKQQLRATRLDVGSGAMIGQTIVYFIMVTTASTLFVHHRPMLTAIDAAYALEPLAGRLARYLFAIGLIGSGLVAIPVLLRSTFYAVSGACGWSPFSGGRAWQRGIYLVLLAAVVLAFMSLALNIPGIELILWSNILAAIIAPLLVISILWIGNQRAIMKDQCLSLPHSMSLVIIAFILVAGVLLLFYQLFAP